MPKLVEIDEEEYLRSQRLRGLVEKIMANPEARAKVEEAQRLIDPKAPTPTLDQRAKQNEPLEAIRKEVTDFIKAQSEAATKRESDAQLTALQAQRDAGFAKLRADGFTSEGITAIEKLMEEKGILDPAIAAAYYEKQHPAPMPTTPTSAWNFPEIPKDGGDAYEKALLDSRGQNDIIAERKALEVLNEIRGQRRN